MTYEKLTNGLELDCIDAAGQAFNRHWNERAFNDGKWAGVTLIEDRYYGSYTEGRHVRTFIETWVSPRDDGTFSVHYSARALSMRNHDYWEVGMPVPCHEIQPFFMGDHYRITGEIPMGSPTMA